MRSPANHRLLFATIVAVSFSSVIIGCASTGHLSTPSGRPEVTVPRSLFRRALLAITQYNATHGRELDQAKPNQIVTYEAVKGPNGDEQVRSKFVYTLVPKNDSLVIESQRIPTTDLDDDASEDAAQPSFELQQQELQQIATMLVQGAARDAEAEHNASLGSQDHSQ